MNTLQALQALIGINYPFDPNMFLVALINANIDPTATYDSSYEQGIDLCCASLILTILTSPSVQEGNMQLSFQEKKELLEVRAQILLKWGISTDKAKIKNKTYKW